MVWSPLSGGKLSGKFARGMAAPSGSRVASLGGVGSPSETERLYNITDCLQAIAADTGRDVPQVALAWVLAQPSVSSVVVGARNEAQLLANLTHADWRLNAEQLRMLDQASETARPYPYSHQKNFPMLFKKSKP